MEKFSNNTDNIFEIVEYHLLVNGFIVIKDFGDYFEDFFEDYKKFYDDTIYNSKDKSYLGGFCNKYHDISENYKDNNYLNKWLSNHFVKKVASQYLGTSNFKLDIFNTFDTKDTEHGAQTPHFDRIPTLKFLLYLNDVEIENGSFCVCPGSHHWVRKNFPLPRNDYNDKLFLEKTRKLPNHIIRNIIPISGKAGQLLIFHTDCIHNQGIVRSGETKIVRAHFRNSYQYTNNDKNYLVHKIKKLLLNKK